MKRSNDASADVAATDRLADYVVTRAPTMSTGTGLPPVALPDAKREPEEPMRPVVERRGERRIATVRSVTASFPGSEGELKGVTNNVSQSGMCLVMSEPPPSAHLDVVVTDKHGSSSVWIQVMSHRLAPTEGYVWHARVTAADGQWDDLLERASTPTGRTRIAS